MARSSYIYIIRRDFHTVALFTVKWEALRFLRKQIEGEADWHASEKSEFMMLRMPDGQEAEPTIIDYMLEFEKEDNAL